MPIQQRFLMFALLLASVFGAVLLAGGEALADPPLETVTDEDLAGCLDQALLSRGGFGCEGGPIRLFCARIHAAPLTRRSLNAGCGLAALRLRAGCEAHDVAQGVCDQLRPATTLPVVLANDPLAVAVNQLRQHGNTLGAGDEVNSTSWSVWLGGLTQFFVNRAGQELVLFLRERIADGLCGGDAGSPTQAVGMRLLPSTCGLLRPDGTTNQGDRMPAIVNALRQDVMLMPARMLSLAVDHVAAPSLRLRVLCVGALAGEALGGDVWNGLPGMLGRMASLAAAPAPGTISTKCTDDAPFWQGVTAATGVVARVATGIDGLQASRDVSPDQINALFTNIMGTLEQGGAPDEPAVRWFQRSLPDFRRLVLASGPVLNRVGASEAERKEFAHAIVSMITVVGDYPTLSLPTDDQRDLANLRGAIDAFIDADYLNSALRLLGMNIWNDVFSADSPARTIIGGIRRFAGIVGSVASARSEEEVSQILQQSAAPLASWREYRTRGAGFIAGHLGVGGGYEVGIGSGLSSGGLVAPMLEVGFEYGRPLGKGWSFNLFVPLIDLGALAAARIGNDVQPSGSTGSTGQATNGGDLSFASVFAPGLFVGTGISNSPFVLMIGAQVAPASRYYFACPTDAACATTETQPTVRAMAYLAIDLPVFPLF